LPCGGRSNDALFAQVHFGKAEKIDCRKTKFFLLLPML